MSGLTATGSSADFAASVELRPGQPQGNRFRRYAVLPSVDVQGKDALAESNKIEDGSGEAEGVPGELSGTFDVGLRTAGGTLLPWLAFFAGGEIQKTEPETGVYRYTFDAVRSSDLISARSFSALLGRNPVDTVRRDGIAPASLNIASGNNAEIAARVQGFSTHGCKFGFARPDAGNAGAYPFEPVLRGTAASHGAPIHVQVESVAPLRVRLEQAEAPTWAGWVLDLSASYDEDGWAVWEVARGADRRHLGVVVGSNWNPLEIVFPGTATDHQALAVGDTWTFDAPGTWRVSDLALPSGDSGAEKTSAAFDLVVWEYGRPERFRVQGADSLDFGLTSGAEPDKGTGSRAAWGILREQPLGASIGMSRKLASRFFLEGSERQKRYGAELTLRGPIVGSSGAYQDEIKVLFRYATLEDYNAPVASAASIVEGFALKAKRTPDESPVLSVEITTDTDIDVDAFRYA